MTDNSDQSDTMAGWRGTLHQWWRTKGLIMMRIMMMMIMIMIIMMMAMIIMMMIMHQ